MTLLMHRWITYDTLVHVGESQLRFSCFEEAHLARRWELGPSGHHGSQCNAPNQFQNFTLSHGDDKKVHVFTISLSFIVSKSKGRLMDYFAHF